MSESVAQNSRCRHAVRGCLGAVRRRSNRCAMDASVARLIAFSVTVGIARFDAFMADRSSLAVVA